MESKNKTLIDTNQTVFSYKLSIPSKDDCRSVFANVSRNRWIAPDNNIVYFVRFELKLFKGENSNPIAVSLTATQFDWFIQCLENGSGTLVVPAEREGKFICYEVYEKLYGNIGLSVIDKKSKFGILLETFECASLRCVAKVLAFIIKFQHSSNEKLKDLIRYLYAYCIFIIMKNDIKGACDGCTSESLIDSEHQCKSKETN
jgi:hypothetical protein